MAEIITNADIKKMSSDGTTIVEDGALASGVVDTTAIEDGAVATADIADSAVTPAKLGGARMAALQFTAALADFTDGESTSGTYTHSVSIPVGAVVTRSLITSVTGFIGDTSATITIGDGTDVDRYNTGTPSVFTTAADVDAGAVSGTAYHSAAKAPVLTVTSASDFSSITAGSVTVTIFYYIAA